PESVRGAFGQPLADFLQMLRVGLPAGADIVRLHAVGGFGFRVNRPGKGATRSLVPALERKAKARPCQHGTAGRGPLGRIQLGDRALDDGRAIARDLNAVLRHVARDRLKLLAGPTALASPARALAATPRAGVLATLSLARSAWPRVFTWLV